MMRLTRGFAWLLSTCVMFSLMGCNEMPSVNEIVGGAPIDASTLFEKVQASMVDQNYEVDGMIDISIGIQSDGLTIDVPLKIDILTKAYSDKAYTVGNIDMSFMGQSTSTKVESYRDGDITYTNKDDEWYTGESDDLSQAGNLALDLLEVSDIKNASMTEEGHMYTVEISMAEVAESFVDLIGLTTVVPGQEFDKETLIESLKDGYITYEIANIDNQYLIQSIEVENIDVDLVQNQEEISMDTNFKLYMSMGFDKYGEITESDVQVPDDILEQAIPLETDVVDENTNTSNSNEIKDSKINFENDFFGSYNGTNLYPGTFDINLFLDTMTYNKSDIGQYTFLPLKIKDNSNLTVYIYNNGDISENTDESILTNKIFEYSIEVLDTSVYNNIPNITFGNGLTFGTSLAKIKEFYGEPDYNYESGDDGYWAVDYDVSDKFNDGYTYEISFYGYAKSGAHGFELSRY